MISIPLKNDIIEKVKKEVIHRIYNEMKTDIAEIILYGSCARGDYSEDSDIDIALITRCSRLEAKKYGDLLADISTEMAMKYFAVVNFVCLPYDEFLQKKGWYPYFTNIDMEGVLLYE